MMLKMAGSTLSEQEYSNLKETGELDLFDLKRDPQTLVMNKKSIEVKSS